MSQLYRIKTAGIAGSLSRRADGARSGRRALIFLWSVATGFGVGLGWYIAATTQMWVLLGVPLGVFQGLVLLPRYREALHWAVATSLGWAVGFVAMWLLSPLVSRFVLGYGWETMRGDEIGWAAALLPFVAVPVVAIAQWLVMRLWVRSERAIFWVGVSVCSFPVAGSASIFLLGPNTTFGYSHIFSLFSYIQPDAPSFWLIGALWGICTGWALAKLPEVSDATDKTRPASYVGHKDGAISLAMAGIGLTTMLVYQIVGIFSSNEYSSFDGYQFAPYWVTVPTFVALGMGLFQRQGIKRALLSGLVIILAEVAIDWLIVMLWWSVDLWPYSIVGNRITKSGDLIT